MGCFGVTLVSVRDGAGLRDERHGVDRWRVGDRGFEHWPVIFGKPEAKITSGLPVTSGTMAERIAKASR
jgi:hypothetical protein